MGIDQAYGKYAPDLKRLAAQHARRFHQELEEVEAEVNLSFVRAYRSLDRRGPLEGRVFFLAHRRLCDLRRLEASRHRLLPRTDADLEKVPGCVSFNIEELVAEVSADAQQVIEQALALDGLNIGIRSIRKRLKDMLRLLGWSRRHTDQVFQEIKEALP